MLKGSLLFIIQRIQGRWDFTKILTHVTNVYNANYRRSLWNEK